LSVLAGEGKSGGVRMDSHPKPCSFSYVLVSAARLRDDCVGIGLIFKARDRSTTKKISQALPDTDLDAATYEALRIALEEAIGAGGGSFTFYVDNLRVVAQLAGEGRAPAELLAPSLQVRALMNGAGSVSVVPVTRTEAFSARRLALQAQVAPVPQVREYVSLQLPLSV